MRRMAWRPLFLQFAFAVFRDPGYNETVFTLISRPGTMLTP